MRANARSLLAAYDVHAQRVARSTLAFAHAPGLDSAMRDGLDAVAAAALAEGNPALALEATAELARRAEGALLYLQRYHWRPLYAVVIACYVLWEACLAAQLLHASSAQKAGAGARAAAGTVALLAASWGALSRLSVPVRVASGRLVRGCIAARVRRMRRCTPWMHSAGNCG
jgi:hypothetical protein